MLARISELHSHIPRDKTYIARSVYVTYEKVVRSSRLGSDRLNTIDLPNHLEINLYVYRLPPQPRAGHGFVKRRSLVRIRKRSTTEATAGRFERQLFLAQQLLNYTHDLRERRGAQRYSLPP